MMSRKPPAEILLKPDDSGLDSRKHVNSPRDHQIWNKIALNEISLSSRINSAGAREFYKIGGTFSGLVINAGNHVQADGDLSTKVYVGQSLVDKLSTYLETITATSGDITKKETYLNARSSEYKEQLTEAETKADIIQARELRKFAEMEKAVTQLKSTGDYITTLMDAWAKES